MLLSFVVLGVIFVAGSRFRSQKQTFAAKAQQITKSEELILALQRMLSDISKSGKNRQLPDFDDSRFFEPSVLVRDLTPKYEIASTDNLEVALKNWQIDSENRPVPATNLRLFSALFDGLSAVRGFKMKIVSGEFSDTEDSFTTSLAVSGSGKLTSENELSFEGHLDVEWRNSGSDGWRISRWELLDFESHENLTKTPFFTRANEACLPNAAERSNAELSIHDELIKSLLLNGGCTPPGPKFEYDFGFESAAACPSVSVVDLNGDGWDDFYLMARWGRNQLFINQQDGTFKESAAEFGLDILNHCTGAAFVDFDNDGDKDLILSRSYARSQILENVGNRFHDVSRSCGVELPAMATSVSVADYNRDGLLDVFFTTYGSDRLLREFLPMSQQEELAAISSQGKHHPVLNALGAPNVLLVNRGGGKFKVAPESPQLAGWKTSLCSVWADYDQDGDADLYVSNDFGPDALMRNDYPNGFKDVTLEEGHESMAGFGMGVSWGDYDLDGAQDLYISNMYSKAGLRIGKQIEGIDPRFEKFNNGNRLYRRKENHFELTSGLKPPEHLVAKVGWSWGGQFADFNNDGFLDIYVPSGYFTAPDAVAGGDDL